MSLRIGTSGWYYDEWVGPFYESKKGMFTSYVKVFDTTEVNSTFYRYPTPRMVEGWNRNSPEGFTFAVKLPQVITHDKWLSLDKDVEGDTGRFLNLLLPLYTSGKLGPILIQLRPKFNYEEHAEALESYLEVLPEEYQWAVEFRNPSWLRPETYQILEKNNAAYTIVDEPLLPPETHVTADFAYIRWHGHGSRPWYNYEYSEGELETWVPKVEETTRKARRTYGYFNNHYSANAVKNAVEILEMLDSANSAQREARNRIVEHRSKAEAPSGVKTLDAFDLDAEGLSVADCLIRFTDTGRLARAEAIEVGEFTIKLNAGGRVKAEIRDYFIDLDSGGRTLRHDCSDWRKGDDQKRLCKHVCKMFMSIPEAQAKEILMDIYENKDRWRFETA